MMVIHTHATDRDDVRKEHEKFSKVLGKRGGHTKSR